MKCETSAKCKHPGCTEWAHFSYDSRKEMREGFQHRQEWKCCRHSTPDEVLSTDELLKEVTLENKKMMTRHNPNEVLGMFWDGISGFVHGNGYKAYAKDFPEGTKLVVTARIILPDKKQS